MSDKKRKRELERQTFLSNKTEAEVVADKGKCAHMHRYSHVERW